MKSSFYVSEKFKHVWVKLAEIAKREGRSRNQILQELAEKYVRLHEPGNPQTRLDLILERRAPFNRPPSCSYCFEPAQWICYLKDSEYGPTRQAYACERHRRLLSAGSPVYGEKKL